MSALFEGDFSGRVTKADYGTDKGGKPQIRVTLEITTEGERRGVQVQYSGNFKQESIKYTKRDMLALGWRGKTIGTFVDDVLDASEAGKVVPFQVRIAEWEDPNTGKLKRWLAAGSIGYEAPPLNAPTDDMTARVDSWFAEVDEPGERRGNQHPNAPGPDSDIPF